MSVSQQNFERPAVWDVGFEKLFYWGVLKSESEPQGSRKHGYHVMPVGSSGHRNRRVSRTVHTLNEA